MCYVELHCKSNYSFLEGASHPDELIEHAKALGYEGLAITDRNSLAGVVRAYAAARDEQFRCIVGAELHPVDGPPVVAWPQDRASYGRLCRLITVGRRRVAKGSCLLRWSDIVEHSEGLLMGVLPREPLDGARQVSEIPPKSITFPRFPSTTELDRLGEANASSLWTEWLRFARHCFGDRVYLMCSVHRNVDDRAKLARLHNLAIRSRVPMLAAGNVLYHVPERMILRDVLEAIQKGMTVDEVRATRPPNAQYFLRTIPDIERNFNDYPEAIRCTIEVASRIDFELGQLRYEYPVELAPDGEKPLSYLKKLTWAGAKQRYPDGVPDKIVAMLRHEFELIESLGYEAYFLTVWDLVRFARERGILCQGRGSAANSVVCYCLGVTSVDPNRMDLLFERFISKERNEPPDIDVDFEHERREEVLQYIYEKYGRDRTGMTATVISYRLRSAVRECGKVLGISEDRLSALSKILDGRGSDDRLAERFQQAGIDPDSEVGKRFRYAVQHLLGFPRHLSQHVGGMVITNGPLCELCPIENAAMEGRTVIEWDKDDLDALGILKVDCLSLGMLSAIRKCFTTVQATTGTTLTLATVPSEDRNVYDMICKADTIGVFQIESRAQMSMLPRLRPRTFYDLVIEVAIVRPGPIQGQMVHPYLQARQSGKQPEYPNGAIKQVLAKTMGVPIFQEQAMRLAVVAAGFTPGEADQLRRAMAAFRRPGMIEQFRRKLIEGMLANGLSQEFAERVFTQIRGFGEYGFPESHAASFALLVYVSAWLKCYYPAAFCAAIINSQPMGFYAPAQLIQDAMRHGVPVRPIDVNFSDWDCTLESNTSPQRAKASDSDTAVSPGRRDDRWILRIGMRLVRGLSRAVAEVIADSRQRFGPFKSVNDLVRRTAISQTEVSRLADAGALNSLTGSRRAALWQSLGQEKSAKPMSLFEAAGADVDDSIPEQLRQLSQQEEVFADYLATGVSLQGHPIGFVRGKLRQLRVTAASDLSGQRSGKFIRVAGIVLMRQRPSTAKGITFVTLEDETGPVNLIVKSQIWESHYLVCKQSNAWLVHGVLETRDHVTHVIAARIFDLSESLRGLQTRSRDFR